MPRPRESDITEKEDHYELRDGPWIMKRCGTGKVLETLLEIGGGDELSEAQIKRVSGWAHPRRQMKSLRTEINAWSRYYEIQARGTSKGNCYRLVARAY